MSMGSKSSFTFVIAHALNAMKPEAHKNIATRPRGVVMAFTYFSHEALVAVKGDAGDCCDTDGVDGGAGEDCSANSDSEADSSGPIPLDCSSSSSLRATARSSRTNTATKNVTWTRYTGVHTKILNVNKCLISDLEKKVKSDGNSGVGAKVADSWDAANASERERDHVGHSGVHDAHGALAEALCHKLSHILLSCSRAAAAAAGTEFAVRSYNHETVVDANADKDEREDKDEQGQRDARSCAHAVASHGREKNRANACCRL